MPFGQEMYQPISKAHAAHTVQAYGHFALSDCRSD